MEKLQGTVEDIIFHNEDNGYSVIKVEEKNRIFVAVGMIPYVKVNEYFEFQGEWVVHADFGKQFKITSYKELLPSKVNDIEKYLSSGIIKGIGPVTAKKIVDLFGENTFNVLDNDISKLSTIEGIGEKKLNLIIESYKKEREVKNIVMYFQNYGISNNQCLKIYKKYGKDSINTVNENPYILVEEIEGIGFKTADKLARNLGIGIDSPFRIKSGIKYVVNEFCLNGNTYIPVNLLEEKSSDMLGVTLEDVKNSIVECAIENKIKIEVLDNVECAYTFPYYYAELSVTKKILMMINSEFKKLSVNEDELINDFEVRNKINFAPSQKEAIIGAITNGVEIITGGPGTGKTTIIKCIIEVFENEGLKVLMGAPTGRASKRMSEATGREAKTIHRLLEMGYGGEEDVFDPMEEVTLKCDVLIIDEASMIDIMLMHNLLKSLDLKTRLVIVGDVDQLPSVGPGNVLKDLIECECIKVVRLKDVFRQAEESMIIINAHRINNKKMPLINEKNSDFYFIKQDDNDKVLKLIMSLINERLPLFDKRWEKQKHIQVLSPMRKGVLGVNNLNIELQKILNPSSKYKREKKFRDVIFRVGDKVMQIKNNYMLTWYSTTLIGEKEGKGVFNGDIGIIDYIDDEDDTVCVLYDNERRVTYDSSNLDELELAYSITVHKSQGSEFPVVIIPIFSGSPFLMNKNILYTAVTRAKEFVVLVGSVEALGQMVINDRSFLRYSSLNWRIRYLVDENIF